MDDAREPAQSHMASSWEAWDQSQGSPKTLGQVMHEGLPGGVCREGKCVRREQRHREGGVSFRTGKLSDQTPALFLAQS